MKNAFNPTIFLLLEIAYPAKDAKYEAEQSNIPVVLVDPGILAKLITQYYDNFDEETKN